MAFGYYSPVTVNAAQVPSAQTNFPMLVSYTDARLKTVGNGGHVQNANGYDIRPYDGIGGSAMTFELERYNASTGEVIMWVLVPSCDVGSIVYLYYGDATISTNGSSASTWNSNFKGVWHLKDGTTLDLTDSTSNANNGTGTSSPAAATGKVDGGMAVTNAAHNYVSAGVTGMPSGTGARTISAWIYQTDNTTQNGVVEMSPSGVGNAFLIIPITAAGLYYIWSNSTVTNFQITSGQFPPLNQWNRVVLTWDGSTIKYYLNGTYITSLSYSSATAALGTIEIGRRKQTLDASFTGSIDEVNILGVDVGADWITTDYNNQSAPSTFATLGTEVSLLNQTNFFRMFN